MLTIHQRQFITENNDIGTFMFIACVFKKETNSNMCSTNISDLVREVEKPNEMDAFESGHERVSTGSSQCKTR